MRRVQRVTVILLAFALLAVYSCGSHQSKLCCLSYQAESDQATYCNNHRNAVLKFVRFDSDSAERQARLSNFEAFYAIIEDCQSVDCIEAAINADTTLPGFKDRYQTEHGFAETDTDIPTEQKAKLILCGFRHAIDGLKETP